MSESELYEVGYETGRAEGLRGSHNLNVWTGAEGDGYEAGYADGMRAHETAQRPE